MVIQTQVLHPYSHAASLTCAPSSPKQERSSPTLADWQSLAARRSLCRLHMAAAEIFTAVGLHLACKLPGVPPRYLGAAPASQAQLSGRRILHELGFAVA